MLLHDVVGVVRPVDVQAFEACESSTNYFDIELNKQQQGVTVSYHGLPGVIV